MTPPVQDSTRLYKTDSQSWSMEHWDSWDSFILPICFFHLVGGWICKKLYSNYTWILSKWTTFICDMNKDHSSASFPPENMAKLPEKERFVSQPTILQGQFVLESCHLHFCVLPYFIYPLDWSRTPHTFHHSSLNLLSAITNHQNMRQLMPSTTHQITQTT